MLSRQAAALSRLKRMSSARGRPASGAVAAQPDHFAAAMDRLRQERASGRDEAQRSRSRADTGAQIAEHAGGACICCPGTGSMSADVAHALLHVPQVSGTPILACMVCAHGTAGTPKGPPGDCSSRRVTGSWCTGDAGGDGQGRPGQQRLARWDPRADREDRLALERLTQRAAAL